MADPLDIEELLIDAVLSTSADWHTGMPGRIESYDAATRTASVLPLLRAKDWETGDTFARPVIPSVPVMFPCGGGARIVWEPVPGDEVWLMFASRDLGPWRGGGAGAEAEPRTQRRFALGDAVCYAGFDRSGLPASVEIRLTSDGKVRIGSPAVDVISTLSDVLQELIAAPTWTVPGTSGVASPALVAQLGILKGLLDTLKVS